LLDRLLWNLVDDGIKYSERGGTVEVAVIGTDETVELVVSDSGPGFPAGAEDSMFERFSRADAAHTSEGTGLGLAIVRAIADTHRARVTARNEPSGGARVSVLFPAL